MKIKSGHAMLFLLPILLPIFGAGLCSAQERIQRTPQSAVAPLFEYIYVGDDGLARELSPKERAYLSETFSPFDGDRPYIKENYRSRDGWGSQAGFMARDKLPEHIVVFGVNPAFDAVDFNAIEYERRMAIASGDVATKNADGSITYSPRPGMSEKERLARNKAFVLAERAAREKRARLPKPEGTR